MPPPRQYVDAAARQRAYRARQAQARHEERQAKGLPAAPPLPTLPSRARWQARLAQARLSLETAGDEMQAYHDARSAAWQEGERAASLLETIEDVDALITVLEDVPSF